MAALFRGFILGVVSGDTVLVSAAVQGDRVPSQKLIKFSGVNAPQLGWKDREDEPFAWAAREALRAKAIGEPVLFRIASEPGGKKAYGEVILNDEPLGTWVVANGWARVREVRDNQKDDAFMALKAAEDAAQSAKLGLWTDDAKAKKHAVRPVMAAVKAAEFFEANGGKPIDALVEGVRTGSTLRLILLPSLQPVTMFVAGIRCPGYTRPEGAESGAAEVPQPLAEEAKFFTELRLLHRTVQVVLEFPDDHGNFFGTVLHPRGNIAESLLREGLAKVVDWAAAHVTYAPALRAAEETAKTARRRVWAGYVPPVRSVAPDAARFSGLVVEVPSGDSVVVFDERAQIERRVFLSSVRAPRMRVGGEARAEPWAFEAKEFVRKRCIGKHVDVTLDYMRRADATAGAAAAASGAAADGAGGAAAERAQTDRFFGTVDVGGKNVATALISQGFATVVRHRDDDERSHHYDELMAAQAKAEKAKAGQHNPARQAPAFKRVDTSGDAAKATMMLDRLRGMGRVPGVVDFVSSGARFKVYLPNEGVIVPFAIAGVRCPRSDTKAPFSAEAQAFARRVALQRDVTLEIDSADKKGTFIGHMFLPDKTAFAVGLLQAGLGWIEGYDVEASPYYAVLADAQHTAKAAKLAYWSTYVEPKALPAEDDETAGDAADAGAGPSDGAAPKATVSKRGGAIYDFLITEVLSATSMYAQIVGDTTAALEALMARFAAHHASPAAAVPPAVIKVGTFVSGQFSVDGCWYRARVVDLVPGPAGASFGLLFIDYGNSELASAAKIRELPAEFLELPPQARKLTLALTLPSPDAEIAAEGKSVVEADYCGQQLLGNVEFVDKATETWHVSLFEGAERRSVAVSLLAAGLIRVDRKSKNSRKCGDLFGALSEAETAAIRERVGIWRYGDIDYDEPAAPVAVQSKAAPRK